MPSYSMDFSDINGGENSSSIYKGKNKQGCYVSTLVGFVLLLLAIILAVGIGILVFFATDREVTCNYPEDNWATGGVSDAVKRCQDFIQDGGNSSGQISAALPSLVITIVVVIIIVIVIVVVVIIVITTNTTIIVVIVIVTIIRITVLSSPVDIDNRLY
nr:hypothetical protein BaRGS_005147 [Batillaria attramentaria]